MRIAFLSCILLLVPGFMSETKASDPSCQQTQLLLQLLLQQQMMQGGHQQQNLPQYHQPEPVIVEKRVYIEREPQIFIDSYGRRFYYNSYGKRVWLQQRSRSYSYSSSRCGY